MDLDRYETSTERRRLTRGIQRRGSQTGFATWGAWLFGCPFVAAGTWIILIGTRTVKVNPQTVHAPYWVLTVAGAVFALGGLMIWGMAVRQVAANRRVREAARRYRDEPAMADYQWDPRGFRAHRWQRALGTLAAAAFGTLFLSMFNWWAFFTESPFMVKAITALFDFFLLLLWWGAAAAVGRALKFGGSRIEFAHFPYRLNEPIVIQWQPPTGINRVRKGTFTLRCVEEWFERTGGCYDRSSRLVDEEVWSGKWYWDEERSWELGKWMEWSFQLPPDALSTHLSADKSIFWEFEVKLDLPGLDFEEVYLVPIYGGP